MQKLFSGREGKTLKPKDHQEKDLQNFIWEHRQVVFPEYAFIDREFWLKGSVQKHHSDGYIDILAFYPQSKRFVVMELKRGYDSKVVVQASNYRDYIVKHLPEVCLAVKDRLPDVLSHYQDMIKNKIVDVVLIAERFDPLQIEQAEKPENQFRLITYHWYADAGDEYLVLDEVLGGNSSGKKSQKKEPNQKKRDWHFYEKKTWNEVVESMSIKKWKERFQKVEFVKGNLDALSLLIAERDEENKRSGKWKKGFMRKRMKELLSELRENE